MQKVRTQSLTISIPVTIKRKETAEQSTCVRLQGTNLAGNDSGGWRGHVPKREQPAVVELPCQTGNPAPKPPKTIPKTLCKAARYVAGIKLQNEYHMHWQIHAQQAAKKITAPGWIVQKTCSQSGSLNAALIACTSPRVIVKEC